MPDNCVVGVRYCGGCNPRYDRAALVHSLEVSFPEVSFEPFRPESAYIAVLAVCGCPVQCALRPEEFREPQIITADNLDALPRVKARMEERLLTVWEAVGLTPEQVRQILPHREPMLFIDSVRALAPGRRAVALFRARPELPCFAGHFPGDPVLPGVYTVEATAQAADILMMTAGRYAGKLPLFMGIERARFRRKILPGDTLEIHVALQEELEKRAIAACRGEVYAGGLLAAELEIRLAFR